MRPYRFAFGLFESATELYTLAIIPAQSDSEAFDKGCAVVPADAQALARAYWDRNGGVWPADSDPDGAFFTAQEIEDDDQLEVWAGDLLADTQEILGGFRA